VIKVRTGNKAGNKSASVIIPIHPIVRNILNKYNNELPPPISNQKLNDYLKIIGKLAELDENVITYKTKGGRPEKKVTPKHDLITTHTARRSFATNAFKAGISSILIMKITGHKTEKSFLRYIRISPEEAAQEMAENKFFQQ
jgi:integrase